MFIVKIRYRGEKTERKTCAVVDDLQRVIYFSFLFGFFFFNYEIYRKAEKLKESTLYPLDSFSLSGNLSSRCMWLAVVG